MTTRMNINPNNLSRITLVFLVLFISSNTFAQKSFKNLDFKTITNSIIKRSTEEIRNAFEDRNEIFYEEEIAFEEWMINLEEFGKKIDSSIHIKNQDTNVSTDKNLNRQDMDEVYNTEIFLEEWMIDYDWQYAKSENDPDNDPAMETWMISPRTW